MKSKTMASFVMPPQTISSANAKSQDWQNYVASVGTTESINGVYVTSQASGIVTQINFKSGGLVKKGELLFKLDTQQLEAQLKQNKATLQLKKITYERDKELFSKNAVSQQQLDQSFASYQEAIGQVESTQANINYHYIYAPFNGKIGIRQINLGQYFQAGSNAASLNQIDPIYVNFDITESNVAKVKLGQTVELTTSSYPGKTFTGKVTATDSTLSNDTLGLAVQATIQNNDPKTQLLPGMFATVHVMLPTSKSVVVIPQSAITYTLYGNTAYILKPDMKDGKPEKAQYSAMEDGKMVLKSMDKDQYTAEQTPIRIGQTRGNEVEILSGVKPNDIVVTSGQLKLKNGSKTVINNDVKLDQKQYIADEKENEGNVDKKD
jgi:membrane fusion protein (multidrug efflux system)